MSRGGADLCLADVLRHGSDNPFRSVPRLAPVEVIRGCTGEGQTPLQVVRGLGRGCHSPLALAALPARFPPEEMLDGTCLELEA